MNYNNMQLTNKWNLMKFERFRTEIFNKIFKGIFFL